MACCKQKWYVRLFVRCRFVRSCSLTCGVLQIKVVCLYFRSLQVCSLVLVDMWRAANKSDMFVRCRFVRSYSLTCGVLQTKRFYERLQTKNTWAFRLTENVSMFEKCLNKSANV